MTVKRFAWLVALLLAVTPVAAQGGYYDDDGFFVFLDGVLTQPADTDQVVGLVRQLPDPAAPAPVQFSSPAAVEWDEEVSSRVGAGYRWGPNRVSVSYWQFEHDQRLAFDGPSGAYVNFTIGPAFYIYSGVYYPVYNVGSPGFVDFVADLEATTVDLAYEHTHQLNDVFDFEWSVGLRYATFDEKMDGAYDIWRRPVGRGEATNLTDNPAEDSQAAWSPDGKRIAFFSNRDAEKLELYLLELESGAIRRLTENTFYDSGAAWSPDGRRIVFTRYSPAPEGAEHGGAGEIIELDVASGEERQLTELEGYNGGLAYSPDGATIAFHRVADGRSEIWFVGADGSDPRSLTDTFIDEYSPEWSPDGEWILFSAGVGSDGHGTFDLWLMRADGTDRRVVSKAANTEGWQKWLPAPHYCR